MTNRRSFLKISGLGIAATALPGLVSAGNSISANEQKKFKFQLGVASYSLREFSTQEALNMTLRLGVNHITFKSMHLPLDSDQASIQKTVALCADKGVSLYGGGVIYMKTKADVDQAFVYAKTAGMEMIIGVPNHELLEYVEGKVKSTGIKLAIHNHGPGDKLYPSAESAYDLIKNMDARMGLCIDIGHTKRINRDPEQDVKDFFDRVFDIHIKDVTKAASDGATCVIGRGVINFPSFLKAVIKLGYNGTLALEYEAEGKDPLAGMAESLGYIKGILATL